MPENVRSILQALLFIRIWRAQDQLVSVDKQYNNKHQLTPLEHVHVQLTDFNSTLFVSCYVWYH